MTYEDAMKAFETKRNETIKWLQGVKQLDANAIDAFIQGYQCGWLDCWQVTKLK